METLVISMVAVNPPVQKNLYLKQPVADAFDEFLKKVGKKQHSVVGTAAILMFLAAPEDEKWEWIRKVSGTLLQDEPLRELIEESQIVGGEPIKGAESIPSQEWPEGAPGVPERPKIEERPSVSGRKGPTQTRSLPGRGRSDNRRLRPKRSPDDPAT